jgi:DNA-binding transcriptional ArsR family regulator
MVNRPDELTVLKALGDETRYAMYRELATSTAPLSAPELAERLGLHANTVRLHLDRLRDAGLIDAEAVHRGTVGRPQHLYFLAGAPGSVRPTGARLSRASSRRWPSASAPTASTPPRPAGLGHRAGSAPLEQLPRGPRGRARQLGFEPASEAAGATKAAPDQFLHARSAGWPRPTRSWVQPAPRALRRSGGFRRRGRVEVRRQRQEPYGRGRVS